MIEAFEQTPLDHNIKCFRVKLEPLSTPDYLDFTLSEGQICLLTDDGSHTSISLAKSLSERGWKVVLLSFPEFVISQRLPLPTGISRVVLADLSEEHLQKHLAAISHNFGAIAVFIHLHPSIKDSSSLESAKAILKHVFLLAKHLKKSLNQAATQGRSCFLSVTRLDGKLGIGEITDFGVISGGLFGLSKTLNLEWEGVFCRALDLSPNFEAASAAQLIIAELHDPNRLLTEVGYSLNSRITLVGEDYQQRQSAVSATSKITPASVFVVSGGGKGITAQCVIKLARRYQCQFILLGRSAINSEPAWVKECADQFELKKRIIADIAARGEKPTPVKVEKVLKTIASQREITATLREIEQVGGKAEYISVDITDTIALKQQLTAAVSRTGAITGIIHGAGNLADKLIEHKSQRDFEAVYAAKVEGLQALLNCINPEQLAHLVLFSSAAGFYGNIGQADYAIANEILNKFAYHFQRQYPRCHVVSFNWGPWDGGMVTPQLKQFFAERQIEIIPIEVGTQILADSLASGDKETVQVLVGSPLVPISGKLEQELQNYQIHRKLSLEANPFLQDHVIGSQAVLPTVCGSAWIANLGEQLYPGYEFFSCEDYTVLKGIVFDETLASDYVLELKEINKSPQEEVELSAKIGSKTATGKPRYHYSGKIKLVRQVPQQPNYELLNLAQNQEFLDLAPYENGTLFHGYSFKGVKRVLNITPETLTMECVLPQLEEQQRGQFPAQALDFIAADVQFQCMLIWVRHYYQAASLPLWCQKGEHFQNIPAGETFYVSMEVTSKTPTKLVANIASHDSSGKIYSRVYGAEVTISKQLNHLFVPNAKIGAN